MAPNITFHLPACAIHAELEQREKNAIAAQALRQMQTKSPFVGAQCACPPPQQQRLSMRFVAERAVQPPTAQGFTFSSLAAIRMSPLASVAVKAEEQCQYVDQYSIGDPEHPTTDCCSRLMELLHGTLISNPVSRKLNGQLSSISNPVSRKLNGQLSSILGPTGHYERFSSWSHLAGFVGFGIYAVVRQVVADNRSTVEGVFASVAAWTVACVFLVSSLYHATAADPAFAKVTRILDYVAIYLGLSIGATADIAAATRGFENVPIVTIVDIPIAAMLLILFFLWRRMRLPTEETWQEDFTTVPPSVECTVGRGLFSKGHTDLHHSQLRQATSLLLTASYFMTIPAAVMTLGTDVAVPVIALQAVGFLLAVLGMLLDRIWEWPNRSLVEGKQASCYPNSCGCVLTSHGLWHLIALVSGACTVAAREYALGSY